MTTGYPTVRMGRHKFIRSFPHQDEMLLFDLEEDPGETRSLANDQAYRSVVDDLNEALRTELTKPAPARINPALHVA